MIIDGNKFLEQQALNNLANQGTETDTCKIIPYVTKSENNEITKSTSSPTERTAHADQRDVRERRIIKDEYDVGKQTERNKEICAIEKIEKSSFSNKKN